MRDLCRMKLDLGAAWALSIPRRYAFSTFLGDCDEEAVERRLQLWPAEGVIILIAPH
jgi:hypothetical protein